MAEAKVVGFQGESLARADTLAATAKHFVGYAAVTAGREYAALELSERTLREVHLPPFAAAGAWVASWTIWLVFAWFVGVLFCSIRLIAGWRCQTPGPYGIRESS